MKGGFGYRQTATGAAAKSGGKPTNSVQGASSGSASRQLPTQQTRNNATHTAQRFVCTVTQQQSGLTSFPQQLILSCNYTQ